MRTYIRPIVQPIGAGVSPSRCGNSYDLGLAGQENLSFSTAELLSRANSAPSTVRSTWMSVRDLQDTETIDADEVQADLQRLTTPRPAWAKLPMNQPHIMGVVNVTPDSFSDGGQFGGSADAIEHALRLADAGAAILDIGGESTRPGSDPVPLEEELNRVLPVIEGVTGRTDTLISIDTRKAEVMRQAADAGAKIVNDVSALSHDPESMRVVAQTGLPVILMHAQGDPKTMQRDPQYDHVVLDIFDYLQTRIKACVEGGIPIDRIVVDPGIGFGKTLAHNQALISQLSLFHGLGVPLLLGVSRKRFIDMLANVPEPKDRLPGSLSALLAGRLQGVQLFRVHDVAETAQALAVWQGVT